MKRLLTIGFLLFGLFSKQSGAQELPPATRQQLENWADAYEDEPDDDALLQQLTHWRSHPLNLNRAEAADLRLFPFLTDLQIEHFLRHRRLFGPLIDVHELQSIPAWDVSTIQKLLPFVAVAPEDDVKESMRNRFSKGGTTAFFRFSRTLQKAKGFEPASENGFAGDANRLLFRYRYQYKNELQYGLTAEKDAGEAFWKEKQKGFDFYSAHLFLRNLGMVKAFALGDFSINLGQGLVHWQSLAFRKSAEVLSIKRQSAVLRPYAAAGEFYFHRGAGITLGKGGWEATLFAAARKLDANLEQNDSGGTVITSFVSSGLHRTQAERENKSAAGQQAIGGNFSFRKQGFSLGLNGVYYRFSHPVQKRAEPYNLFAMRGNNWANFSADYSYTFRNLHFFGEVAIDKNGDRAFVNGLLMSLAPQADLSVLYRNIAAGYAAVYGNAFTESVAPANEKGWYLGLRLRPVQPLTFNAYADVYSFPWLKFRADAPGRGADYLLHLTYQPNKQVEVYTRFRLESKTSNEATAFAATNHLTPKTRQNWRLHFSYQLSRQWVLRSRAEVVWFDKRGKKPEEGFLLFAEGGWRSPKNWGGNLRLAFFETDSYNSRVYSYESDVLYSFSIPPVFDKGIRTYLNLNYDLTNNFSLWLRWAQTIYRNKEVIGSGLDAIPGNQKAEVKIQLVYRQ